MFEVNDKDARKTSLRFQRVSIVEFEQDNVCWEEAVFLTQIISRQQKKCRRESCIIDFTSAIFRKLYFSKYSVKRCCKQITSIQKTCLTTQICS